jgi:hypothetical protein
MPQVEAQLKCRMASISMPCCYGAARVSIAQASIGPPLVIDCDSEIVGDPPLLDSGIASNH